MDTFPEESEEGKRQIFGEFCYLATTPSPRSPSQAPSPAILYMQGEQGLGCLLLQSRAVEWQVADLLALGIQQEGPCGRRGHIRTR